MKLFFHYCAFRFSNCYVLGAEDSSDAIIIDPGSITEGPEHFAAKPNGRCHQNDARQFGHLSTTSQSRQRGNRPAHAEARRKKRDAGKLFRRIAEHLGIIIQKIVEITHPSSATFGSTMTAGIGGHDGDVVGGKPFGPVRVSTGMLHHAVREHDDGLRFSIGVR